jgi:integrase/recombinase XerD
MRESLEHTDIRTTENYMDSFEKKIKKEFAENLTAYK